MLESAANDQGVAEEAVGDVVPKLGMAALQPAKKAKELVLATGKEDSGSVE